MEIFKGKLENCLGHFLKNAGKTEQEEKKSFLKFVGVKNRTTVSRWANGRSQPNGFILIKVLFYLGHKNYEIEEINSLPAETRAVVQGVIDVLALDIATPQAAAAEIGYAYDYDLYRVLAGRRNPSEKALQGMKDFYSRHRPAVLGLLRNFFGKGEIVLEKTASQNPEPAKIVEAKKGPPANYPGSDRITADLISLLGSSSASLETFLDYYFNGASAEERQTLRDIIEKDGRSLFKISNSFYRVAEKLNGLCTEKSFETYNQKKKKNE